MKKISLWVLLFLLGVGVLGCQQKAAETPKNIVDEMYPEEQSKIEKMLAEIFDTAKAKELDRLEAFHLYGPKFTKFDDWEPLARQDAETGKKSEREAFAAISDLNYSLQDVKVDVFGDVAIATFYIDYSLKMGENAVATKSRSTLVLVKDGGIWKITHEHFSPLKSNP